MKIKNGLRLIAIGFIFTLVNINITFDQTQINIMPDFIGWILIGAASVMLKEYTKKNPFYLIGAILLALCDAAILVVRLVLPKLDISIYETGVSLFSILYIFLLLSKLEKIGKDKGYNDVNSVRILKYVYLIVYLIFQALTFAADLLPIRVLAVLFSISGIAALVTAIATAFVLFKMSIQIDE